VVDGPEPGPGVEVVFVSDSGVFAEVFVGFRKPRRNIFPKLLLKKELALFWSLGPDSRWVAVAWLEGMLATVGICEWVVARRGAAAAAAAADWTVCERRMLLR